MGNEALNITVTAGPHHNADVFRSHFGIDSAQQADDALSNLDALWASDNDHMWAEFTASNGEVFPADREGFDRTAQEVKDLFDSGEYKDGELAESKPTEEGQDPWGSSSYNHTANESSEWKAICTTPDYCKVGNSITPFDSFANIGNQTQSSPDVNAQGSPVYRVGDMHQGIQADAGEGVVSGTSLGGGHVLFLDGQNNVRVNGQPMVRHDSQCLVNCNASGVGGALGRVVTEPKQEPSSSEPLNPDAPPGERTSERLQTLEQMREAMREGLYDFDSWDEVVDFDSANQWLDNQVAKIQGAEIDNAGIIGDIVNFRTDLEAQVVRGALGFVKDIVMGVGELAYEGVKGVGKLGQRAQTTQGQIMTQLDAAILEENIRLGNITAGSTAGAVWDGAKGFGKALVSPITEAWGRGDYGEAVTRGVLETVTLPVAWLKGTKLGKLGKLGQAGKTKTASHLDDATDLGKSADTAADAGKTGVHVAQLSRAERYAQLVNANKRWSWNKDFPGGENLTRGEKAAIKREAIAKGLIPDVQYKPGTRFPDFGKAGLINKVDNLPENLWKAGDQAQFNWLDARVPGGRPQGFTWHHSEIPGRMELVPFGPHNIIPHSGGRSPGMWAHAPR